MPGLDTESQFKFLISCIKHSNAGKVDFVEVANELGIVTKAAAAKRYERLMKAHNITAKGPLLGPGATPAASSGNGSAPSAAKKRPAKKRKIQASSDDDDEVPDMKQEVKKETKKEKTKDAKEDPDDVFGADTASVSDEADDAI